MPENARWSVISSAAHTPEIGTVIDNAMRAIESENKILKNVLPKNYATPDLDKRVLGDVVDLFTNMDMSGTEDSKDLLGRTYEYCIAQFAAYEGVKGGEFYTPSSIVKTIVSVLKPFSNCRVYDPCCGSGGMFVQSAKFIQAHSNNRGAISVYGQESKEIDEYSFIPLEDNFDEFSELRMWLDSDSFKEQLSAYSYDFIEETRLIKHSSTVLMEILNISENTSQEDLVSYSIDAILRIGYTIDNQAEIFENVEVCIVAENKFGEVYFIDDIYRNEDGENNG